MKTLRILSVTKGLGATLGRQDVFSSWKTTSESGVFVKKNDESKCVWIAYNHNRDEFVVYVGVPQDIDPVYGNPVRQAFREKKFFNNKKLQEAIKFMKEILEN